MEENRREKNEQPLDRIEFLMSVNAGTVLDHERPRISGSIRSIKMYSWAQCIVKRKIV